MTLKRSTCSAFFLAAVIAITAASCLLRPAEAEGGSQGPRGIRHVILVSVDGLMPGAYLDPDRFGLRVPMLREMARHGAYSEGVVSVFPTLTYPAHTSLATGVTPAKHGIVSNVAWDPLGENQGGLRWYAEDIRVPTLWDAARQKGLRTALVFWPVTVGAAAKAIVPEYWRAETPDDYKLVRALSTPGVFEAMEKRNPRFRELFTPPQVPDEVLTDIAVYFLEAVRPHLLMLHIFQVDHWQHEDGPMAGRALAALENADQQIARLVQTAKNAGIWDRTALVVVSDHGFAPVRRRVRPGVWLRQKGLVTLDERNRVTDWKAVVVTTGGCAFFYVRDRNDETTRRVLVETFSALAAQPGSGIGRVFTAHEVARFGGDPEAVLAIEAAEGFSTASGYTGDALSDWDRKGAHGFAPDRQDMRSSLLVYGPRIGPGKIEGARLIDVAPTVAQWLSFRLGRTDGAPLEVPSTKP